MRMVKYFGRIVFTPTVIINCDDQALRDNVFSHECCYLLEKSTVVTGQLCDQAIGACGTVPHPLKQSNHGVMGQGI